jgi:hypothetical protein
MDVIAWLRKAIRETELLLFRKESHPFNDSYVLPDSGDVLSLSPRDHFTVTSGSVNAAPAVHTEILPLHQLQY